MNALFQLILTHREFGNFRKAYCDAYKRESDLQKISMSDPDREAFNLDPDTFNTLCMGVISNSWNALSMTLPTEQAWDKAARRALDSIIQLRLEYDIRKAQEERSALLAAQEHSVPDLSKVSDCPSATRIPPPTLCIIDTVKNINMVSSNTQRHA